MRKTEVVAAVIRDGEGRVLATQRGYGDWKGWWEFPGGKTEPGETREEALRREIREELSAEICIDRFLCTVEHDYPGQTSGKTASAKEQPSQSSPSFHLTMHCFLCSLPSGAMHLNEHEAARWLRKGELDSVRWLPADMQVLEALEREAGIFQDTGQETGTTIGIHE